jgi:hypothetical protein
MNDHDRRLEEKLRAQTGGWGSTAPKRRDARSVLADFYESRGQLSRAALWREEDPGRSPRDNLVPDSKCRRHMVMWLLSNSVPHEAVAKAFRLSPSWARALIRAVESKICEAANEERHHPTLAATRRLQEAGALPKPYLRGVFWLGDEPPESWPVTLRRRKARSL